MLRKVVETIKELKKQNSKLIYGKQMHVYGMAHLNFILLLNRINNV